MQKQCAATITTGISVDNVRGPPFHGFNSAFHGQSFPFPNNRQGLTALCGDTPFLFKCADSVPGIQPNVHPIEFPPKGPCSMRSDFLRRDKARQDSGQQRAAILSMHPKTKNPKPETSNSLQKTNLAPQSKRLTQTPETKHQNPLPQNQHP